MRFFPVLLGAALLALQAGCSSTPVPAAAPASGAPPYGAADRAPREQGASPPELVVEHVNEGHERAAAGAPGFPITEKSAVPDPPIRYLGAVVDARPTARKIDLTTEPDDLWERIRSGFAMPDLRGPLVRDRERWYANQARALESALQRSKLYLYHIVEELEDRGMPMELALLPLVESSFNPMATSRADASGLWQFIPSTGNRYKLKQDGWYDGRRDIIASTDAALDYLEFLYETLGDWHRALACYNWGENAVLRAVERNRAKRLPTDYSHLMMPVETRFYVPKLQALKNIIADPARFGVDLDAIPNRPFFATVKTQEIDIRLAAKLAETPVEEIKALNPGHKGPVFQAHRTAELLLPATRVRTFLANLSRHQAPLVSWQRYRFRRADSLTRLAALHGISLTELRRANGIYAKTLIKPGTLLLVPMKHAGISRASKSQKGVSTRPTKRGKKIAKPAHRTTHAVPLQRSRMSLDPGHLRTAR